MSEDQKQFKMRFDPNTIRHLGIKMYSQIPGALAELIANAYDADATKVSVNLDDREMKIVVEDNGMGMTAEEINEKFLVIGRNRREGVVKNITPRGRIPSGKKGLGKLALFGIGNKIKVETKSADKEAIAFVMDWKRIQSHKQPEYNPEPVDAGEIKGEHGTVVTISDLSRKSPFNQDALAKSMARFFNYLADGMDISISVNKKTPVLVTHNALFSSLEIELEEKEFPPFFDDGKSRKITGRIVTNASPVSPDIRGVALYANGRMVNKPEFFVKSASGHFYTYVTGYLVVDFVDEGHGEDDLISTNRESLNWEYPRIEKLREYLNKLMLEMEKKWRKIRGKKAKKKMKGVTGKEAGFDDLLPNIQDGIASIVAETPQIDPEKFVEKLINYVGPKRTHKRILISHTGDDKRLADVIYDDLLSRGVAAEHILYTSSENPLSDLPPRKNIYDYLRKFFVQHWVKNPHVIFVVSKNMEKSWGAVLEAGAVWITQTEHTLAVDSEHFPKRPLNPDDYPYIAFGEDGLYRKPSQADRVLDAVVSEYKKNQKAD